MLIPWPALSQEAITGVAGDAVAGWSVVLWMLAAALAWGCLLAGTATANRVAFLPSILIFIYFTGAMTASLPRSWWNLALTLGAAGAVMLCEARSATIQATSVWRGIITCVPAGMMTGLIMIAATPARRWGPGWVLPVGLAVGLPLGIGLWWCGRRLAWRIVERGSTPFLLRLDVSVAILAGLHLCLTTSLAARGGLLMPAQNLQQLRRLSRFLCRSTYLLVSAWYSSSESDKSRAHSSARIGPCADLRPGCNSAPGGHDRGSVE